MKAVLYICHGSRVKAGQQAALDFIEQTKPLVDAEIQEACFLELALPSIAMGIVKCIDQGATEIIAVPFLLLTAGHANTDIPEALIKAMELYPDVPLYYGDTLGVHSGIVDVLSKRITDVGGQHERATVLLVGRGSSDPVIDGYFLEISNMLQERTGIKRVEVCYLAARGPYFEEMLLEMLNRESSEVFVVPYLLFTGILMESMAAFINSLEKRVPVHLCEPLGYDPVISQILAERVDEAVARREPINVPVNG